MLSTQAQVNVEHDDRRRLQLLHQLSRADVRPAATTTARHTPPSPLRHDGGGALLSPTASSPGERQQQQRRRRVGFLGADGERQRSSPYSTAPRRQPGETASSDALGESVAAPPSASSLLRRRGSVDDGDTVIRIPATALDSNDNVPMSLKAQPGARRHYEMVSGGTNLHSAAAAAASSTTTDDVMIPLSSMDGDGSNYSDVYPSTYEASSSADAFDANNMMVVDDDDDDDDDDDERDAAATTATSGDDYSSTEGDEESSDYYDDEYLSGMVGGEDAGELLERLAPEYDEFDTIDWIRDEEHARRTRDEMDVYFKSPSTPWYFRMLRQLYRVQAWIYVLLVGATTGVLAACIDVAVDVLTDLRYGYCSRHFWLSKAVCCDRTAIDQPCTVWITWASAFGAEGLLNSSVVNYASYVAWAMLFAGLACWLVSSFARWAAGSGIPEMKTVLGGFVINMFHSAQTLVIKVVGLVLAVASGLNLGKEGPLVHVAGATADLYSKLFPKYSTNEAKKREILSAAVASGVSVAFGAPVGGVLFSLEEASYYFPHKTLWRSFFAAAMGALLLQAINPLRTSKLVIFQVSYAHSWRWVEMPFFLIIGAIGGLVGKLFIAMNLRICELRKKTSMRRWPVLECVVVAAVTAVCSWPNPYTSPAASEVIADLFDVCAPAASPLSAAAQDTNTDLCARSTAWVTIGQLLMAAVVKLVLTIFTYGLRVPSGLFIPSMGVGACIGRAIGIAMQQWHDAAPDAAMWNECIGTSTSACVIPGVYGLIGAAAVLAGVTRMTVSLTVIMYELTGDPDYIVPIMLAVMTAKWVGDSLGGEGIYDEHILLNEYPYLSATGTYRFAAFASTVMRADNIACIVCPTPMYNTIGSLRAFVQRNLYSGFPILASDGDAAHDQADSHSSGLDRLLLGYISRFDLETALRSAEAKGMADSTPCVFRKRDALAMPAHIEFIDLKSHLDVAPIHVQPTMPLNVLFSMFKALGLRYVLVVSKGHLRGVITKKDVLQYISLTVHHKLRTFLPNEADATPIPLDKPAVGGTLSSSALSSSAPRVQSLEKQPLLSNNKR
jgi:chloride channel 3/4/5